MSSFCLYAVDMHFGSPNGVLLESRNLLVMFASALSHSFASLTLTLCHLVLVVSLVILDHVGRGQSLVERLVDVEVLPDFG